MKIKYMTDDYWNIIKTKGILLSHRLWTITIEIPGYIPRCHIREISYLYGKEIYTKKIYEDRKGKYKEEYFIHNQKKQYQTYVRGLRRNINKNYNTFYIIKEKFIESEEARI